MTIQEAIEARHSVRAYKDQPLTEEVVNVLNEKIAELNKLGSTYSLFRTSQRHSKGSWPNTASSVECVIISSWPEKRPTT